MSVFFPDEGGLSGSGDVDITRISYHVWLQNTTDSPDHIALLILTDSSNAFPPGHGGGPRSLDKHSRIHMWYIRDGIDRYNLSYAAAGFNIADCRGKRKPSYRLEGSAWIYNRCAIGFPIRDEMGGGCAQRFAVEP